MTAGSGAGDDRVEVVACLSAVPDRLAAASRSAVGRPMPAGEWGPTEVVRHLIAVEESVWLARLTTLAAGQKLLRSGPARLVCGWDMRFRLITLDP
jgi:hypothetical protein